MSTLNPKEAQGLVARAVAAIAGDKAAKKVAPSFDAALELARQTAIASYGKPEITIASVKVTVDGGDQGNDEPVTAVFSKRQPTDAGPKKRTPIRVGGGTCFTIRVGKITITICIDWHS